MKRLQAILLLLTSATIQYAVAGWPCSPNQSVAVAVAPNSQWNARLAGDGNGGAFMVWQDRRTGGTDKLYIQHVAGTGDMLFASGGMEVSETAGFQYYPQIIPDGSGGAIVVWQDNRSGVDYDIYAQRITAAGAESWPATGALVCGAAGNQYYPQEVSDGAGGVIVTWQDFRNGNYDIYAQRLNASGMPQWTLGGVAVCSDASPQTNPQLASDGVGGALVVWADYRSGGTGDIYCQRISSSGVPVFAANGVAVCSAVNTQWNPQIVSDGAQGAVVCWQDRRSGAGDQIYAQRVNAGGVMAWTANGVQLAPTAGIQYYPSMVSDGAGGAVAVWQDNRTGTDYDIYAQRVSASGQILWPGSGQPVCTSPGQQYNPQAAVDGQSILLAWQDLRNGTDFDIYAQRLDPSGNSQWTANGAPVFVYQSTQTYPQIVGDGVQGAVIAWADYRDGSGTTDLYAQRIGASGKLAGGCYRSFTQDSLALRGIRMYINKKTPIHLPTAGNVRDTVFKRGAFPAGITVGVPRPDSGRYYGWEVFVRSSNVRNALPDTGIARPFDRLDHRKFTGLFRNLNPRIYNNSLVGEMLALNINIAASDLGVTDSQFGDLIFNDASNPTNPLNHKTLRQAVTFIDTLLSLWPSHLGMNYRQLALSLHSVNEAFDGAIDTVSTKPLRVKSTKALFGVSFLTPNPEPLFSVPKYTPSPEGIEIPSDYVLYQNYPNPFNPTTHIEFDLPRPSVVTLKVYTILGQEAATLLDHVPYNEGNQQAYFDATNLSSGVYFYRLWAEDAAGSGNYISSVKKMILLK